MTAVEYLLKAFEGAYGKKVGNVISVQIDKAKEMDLKIRQLSAETCHEFIEWCGLVDGQDRSNNLDSGVRLYKNDLYYNFIDEYPDYGPRGRMSISRTKFYRWLVSYAIFKENTMPEEGRDQAGRWMIIKRKQDSEHQNQLNYE
jgi:hypothetical protein